MLILSYRLTLQSIPPVAVQQGIRYPQNYLNFTFLSTINFAMLLCHVVFCFTSRIQVKCSLIQDENNF